MIHSTEEKNWSFKEEYPSLVDQKIELQLDLSIC